MLATQRAPQTGRASIRGHTALGLLPWGQGQTKSGKTTPVAPASLKTGGAVVSDFLVNYFLINNKLNTAAIGKLMK